MDHHFDLFDRHRSTASNGRIARLRKRAATWAAAVMASAPLLISPANAHPEGHQSQAASATERGVPSEADRQLAHFDHELLLHLVRYAPSPLQSEMIDLAEADRHIALASPVAPDLERLQTHRDDLHRRLRAAHAVVPVLWDGSQIVLGERDGPIRLTRGLTRWLLVDLANQDDETINIQIRGIADSDAPEAYYAVLPGCSQLIPLGVEGGDAAVDLVPLELSAREWPEGSHRLELPVAVSEPAILRGTLLDADRREPWPGRLYALCSDGVFRHGTAYAGNETLSIKQLLQFVDDGRFYKLPFFYSDGAFEIVVPAGETRLTLERGFEHALTEELVDLAPGEVRNVALSSGRLVDMPSKGWISGDTHIHWVTNQWNVDLPLELLATVQRAEDLRIANNLTLLHRRANQAFINPSQAPMGTVEAYSDGEFHLEMGEEDRNENLYGHLCFLNLDWLVMPIGTGPQIAGADTLDYPLNRAAILACREQGGISCEAHGLGGNKDVPVNVVHDLTDSLDQMDPEEYYNFLDCGFRIPLTNGSDHPARVVGCARAYVKIDGPFTYDRWINGIRQGRTFTTSGPLLLLTVDDATVGDVIAAEAEQTLSIRVEAISRKPLGRVQIISNGEVLREIETDAATTTVELTMRAGESRWIVARCSRSEQFNAIWAADVAHTSAIYVEVEGRPRFKKETAELWIRRMKQHIRDIRARGQFANDSQRGEAIQYVRDGISRYQERIAAWAGVDPTQIQRTAGPATDDLTDDPTADAESRAIERSQQPRAPATAAGKPAWPQVEQVDSQPLLVQVDRLREALDYIGNPLPQETVDRFEQLHAEADSKKIASAIQALLDPLCLAAVSIEEDRLAATPRSGRHELVEQGWRTFLVKVDNRAGSTERLRVESPNARPMPHARQDEVASRWLGLSMFDGRPLQANLSGLELEYRIIQLYSRDAGPQLAALEFAVDPKPGKPGRQIREWRFDHGVDGWEALNQSELESRDGRLYVRGTGSDPFIGAEVSAGSGKMTLRFSAETEQDGVGQVFWRTEQQPTPDATRTVSFPLIAGGRQAYEVTLPISGTLAGIRIDPNGNPCEMVFDWIDLAYAHRRGETWDDLQLKFDARPAVPVTLRIEDKPGEPAVAALVIRDKLGRIYPEQTKRLAPDLFFHPQIYRADRETILLPPGEYSVRCWRGPHSIPETKQLTVGREPTELAYQVRRWVDPTIHGWWSGDHHIHAAGCLHYVNPTEGVLPSDMLRQTMGEDMNVGCCLTWGPCFDYQKQFFTGNVHEASQYPYLIRYDIEVSGFGSHASGHLNLLRLQEQIYPGGDSKDHWPTLGLNTLRWAKKQDAVCGPAHSGAGLTNYLGRVGDYEDGPHGLPHYNLPAFDGIGANEYIVDVTHQVPGPDGSLVPAIDFISTMNTPRHDEWNMWYHTLNCGFRVRASGETDFPCMSGERVGIGRVYVKVDGRLNYADWVQGIQDGRSYVSDGQAHLIDFAASIAADESLGVGEQGSEIVLDKPQTVDFTAKAAVLLDRSADPGNSPEEVEVELIVNAYPVASTSIPADGNLHEIRLQANFAESSWVALRIHPHAHANPFFVTVAGKPIRASRGSAEWCLQSVEQCWRQKERTYAPAEHEDARRAYEHAQGVYQAILETGRP